METHKLNQSKRRFEPLNTKCSFCKTGAHNNDMEDNCFSSIYSVQNRTNVVVYRNVKFNEIKIGIPRCKKCRITHKNVKVATNIGIFVGVLLVFIIPISVSVMFSLSTAGLIFMMVLTIGLLFLGISSLESGILNANDVKSEKEGTLKEPLVREFLLNGWSIDRPTA